MTVLETAIDRSADGFRANAERMSALVADLRAKAAEVALGGGERARARHLQRGKLLPRDRVHHLLDPGSPFLECSQLAAWGMYGESIPSAGIITGIDAVDGKAVGTIETG